MGLGGSHLPRKGAIVANQKKNVLAAKPKLTGGISVAPLGTVLPTSVDEALDAAFKATGYTTEDGVTRSQDRSSSTIKAWGGDAIFVTDEGAEASLQFNVAEYLNAAALALVYGDENVVVTDATAEHGTLTAVDGVLNAAPHVSLVIDVFAGKLKGRLVFPDFKATDIGDTTFVDTDLAVHDITGSLLVDETGAVWHEYWDDGVKA
jgi:hypothetical protein